MTLCMQCQKRPIWKTYSVYVCRECSEHLMAARAQCPCPCHPMNQYPARCCTDQHLVDCPEQIGTIDAEA